MSDVSRLWREDPYESCKGSDPYESCKGSEPDITENVYDRTTSTVVIWRITHKEDTRVIRLSHGKVFGGRTIRVDGEVVMKKRKIIDGGSTHPLLVTFGGHMLQIRIEIRTDGLKFTYHIHVDTLHDISSDDMAL